MISNEVAMANADCVDIRPVGMGQLAQELDDHLLQNEILGDNNSQEQVDCHVNHRMLYGL